MSKNKGFKLPIIIGDPTHVSATLNPAYKFGEVPEKNHCCAMGEFRRYRDVQEG